MLASSIRKSAEHHGVRKYKKTQHVQGWEVVLILFSLLLESNSDKKLIGRLLNNPPPACIYLSCRGYGFMGNGKGRVKCNSESNESGLTPVFPLLRFDLQVNIKVQYNHVQVGQRKASWDVEVLLVTSNCEEATGQTQKKLWKLHIICDLEAHWSRENGIQAALLSLLHAQLIGWIAFFNIHVQFLHSLKEQI